MNASELGEGFTVANTDVLFENTIYTYPITKIGTFGETIIVTLRNNLAAVTISEINLVSDHFTIVFDYWIFF
jgi:hypothetical protein